MDPHLIHNPNWAGIILFFMLMAMSVFGILLFHRSTNGDWVDEEHGQGSVDDEWGLPTE